MLPPGDRVIYGLKKGFDSSFSNAIFFAAKASNDLYTNRCFISTNNDTNYLGSRH